MPKTTTMVSILIPVYNRKDLIRETVDCALAQTYPDFEVVIADNCSTDGTWEILQDYAAKDGRVKLVRNPGNIGPVRNWRRCIDTACGEYGKILWSDDLIEPDFLEKTLPYLENDAGAGFVFTSTKIFSSDGNWKKKAYVLGSSGYRDSETYIQGVLLQGLYPVSPGCALFRLRDLKKNVLVEVPNKVGSDFAMHAIGNDLLTFLLTARQYPRFAYVSDMLSYFRAHSGSISISSENGKLPLHYDLAKAFFVERYRPELIRKINVILKRDLFRYKSSVDYGIFSISDFYMDNHDFSVDPIFFAKKVLNKILRFLKIPQCS